MSMRILVTGGAGFIGSRLAERFAEDGASVTIFDNFNKQVASISKANAERLERKGVRVVEGDICHQDAIGDALAESKPQVVYHLAAETGTGQSWDIPAHYTQVNITGTANLVEALRNCNHSPRRVILAGSRAVYGEGACVDSDGKFSVAVARRVEDLAAGDYGPKDRDGNTLQPIPTDAATCPASPASIYASTKLMQEYVLSQGLWGSQVQVGILRLQNVYGPGQALDNPYTGVLSIFARQIFDDKIIEIYEDGHITRDFVFIEDVVDAFYRMGTVSRMPLDVVDIGSGHGETILNVASLMLEMMGKDKSRIRVSGRYRPGDIRHACADIVRAKQQLGWRPNHDLRDGLSRLIEWSQLQFERNTNAMAAAHEPSDA